MDILFAVLWLEGNKYNLIKVGRCHKLISKTSWTSWKKKDIIWILGPSLIWPSINYLTFESFTCLTYSLIQQILIMYFLSDKYSMGGTDTAVNKTGKWSALTGSLKRYKTKIYEI